MRKERKSTGDRTNEKLPQLLPHIVVYGQPPAKEMKRQGKQSQTWHPFSHFMMMMMMMAVVMVKVVVMMMRMMAMMVMLTRMMVMMVMTMLMLMMVAMT